MTQPPPNPRETRYYFALAQIGLEMVAPIGIGLFIDYLFGWLPWATATCAVVGFVGAMVHLIVMVQQHDAEERRPPGGAT
jgi:hypothetical protein